MQRLILHTPAQLSVHLRSFRKARRLTQAQLGALVGLEQTRIAKIERDPGLVSIGQLMQLLAALQVRVALEPLPGGGTANAVSPNAKSKIAPSDW